MSRFGLTLGLMLAACGAPSQTDGGTGGGAGGGGGGGGDAGLSAWNVQELDGTAGTLTFAVAFDATAQRVGVVYLAPKGTETMPGVPDYELKYVEWKQGALVGAPQTIRTVQRYAGLAIAFDPSSGEPVISYLGGANGFVPGESIFWFQSDAVINTRSGTTWTERAVAVTGDQVACGNPVSDRGFLVGLWPALLFNGPTLIYAYRDAHDGQFGMQDWRGSDVEVWEGGMPPTMGRCAAAGGNVKRGYGGHMQLISGKNGVPSLLHERMEDGADSTATEVFFQKRNADGSWSTPASVVSSATQEGSSLAYDATEGYGLAVFNPGAGQLRYYRSDDGSSWDDPGPIFASGSGGWYPGLAMDPINHEPAIAFYVCSPRSGVQPGSCPITEDDTRILTRIAGNWREETVTQDGAFTPKLGFFASGKRVMVYLTASALDPATGRLVTDSGKLKLAVER